MGRGKVELKRIEDKTCRQVSFSKRRSGLMKKACELSVLCDVDLALFVFSPRGRLYEFSSGESSMTGILTRFQAYKNAEEVVRRTVHEKLAPEHTDVWTADEIMEMVQWQLERHNLEQLDVGSLNQLEQQFDTFLQQVKMRKSQQMSGVLEALQDEQKQLIEEKEFMIGEIMAARMKETNNDRGMTPPQQLPVGGLQFI